MFTSVWLAAVSEQAEGVDPPSATAPPVSAVNETFENPQLEQMLGRSLPGAKFLRKVNPEDFKHPAGFLEYAARYKLPAGEVEVRVRNYLVYLGRVMLQIQFHLVQGAGEDRLKEFDDEMKQIVDTLDFARP